MTREQVDKRINDIACRVYDVDPGEPDPQQFAIEADINVLLDDLGVIFDEQSTDSKEEEKQK